MRPTPWLSIVAVLLGGVVQAQQGQRPRPPRTEVEAEVMILDRDGPGDMRRADSTRAWLGIATGGSGRRDTLGLLIEDIVPGSPAAKAGLQEGERLTSINGTSLRLPAADADDPGMGGVLQRRLTRVLAGVAPGAEVELGVHGDGRSRSIKVKTIAASEAPDSPPRWMFVPRREPRAAIGVSLLGEPSRRDSAGVFVSAVTTDGPAEKAGIVEGDRIAAINGQDLRVAREDAGDAAAARARASRLQRALGELKPGDEVELRVVTAGRGRTVKVKTVSANELAGRGMIGQPMGDVELEMRGAPRRWPMTMPPGGQGGLDGDPEQDVRLRINGEDIDMRRFMEERVPGVLRQFRFEGGPSPQRIEVRRERRITI